ncbi:UNVERIFIED_CONTAM: hypothetical protein PYX00_005908 [Menopon gallinae]|uniref:Pleckstrin homology domain-containing protein n=1 Tax=Menopon gallinae TaxID=328185 RepID=A0AAW2HT19_9NEOP
MREAHLPHSVSGLPEGQQPRMGQPLPQSKTKDEELKKMADGPDDMPERIDYYDRGKSVYQGVNGYPEWGDPYADRKSELPVRDYMDTLPERRRTAEGEYYPEQYPDQRMYSRHCGTLPMVKGTNVIPVPSLSLQGSSVGRSVGTLDSRTSGKDIAGKRARLADLETPKRMEHLQKLEELKKHLLDLEKQYEKGKPLVNLVDNMVKLGSLYRGNSHVYNGSVGLDHSFNVREKLEFNQKVQEQRLLAEERRDWDRLSPDHGQLQAKVQQLYRLDRLLQEESGTLQSLQQDKELLEKALGGLRHKLQINRSNPVEADRYRKQQKLLEKELSRVRLLLAHNSKKLEETVAENARLEQELVILRQKLQASRVSSRNSVPLLPESTTISTTAALEAELRRVQQLVGDLQRQRHELSAQVKQLTEKSDTLVQQIRPGPTGVAGAGPIPGKKKSSSTWLETDLDLLVTQDVGVESPVISPQHQQQSQQPSSTVPLSPRSTTPIYINTEVSKRIEPVQETSSGAEESKSPSKPEVERTMTYCTPVELSEADDRMKRFYGIIPREKQEIKTVRIVKRESERRQRDRDRSGNIGIPVGNTAVAKRVSVIEENDSYGLGKVEEESCENYQGSPNFSEQSEEYQTQKANGEYRVGEVAEDPYMHFHPTNPFLPQNLANLETEMEDIPGRSMSLPRGFGKTPDTRSAIAKRNRFQEGGSENGNDRTGYRPPVRGYNQRAFSPNRGYYPGKEPDYLQVQVQKPTSPDSNRPLTAREQLFGANYYTSPEDGNSPQLSPVYQSEAAREIIMEMSSNSARNNANRRQVPREKRRHHTVSNIRHVYDSDSHFSRMGSARSRDDLDMERALRPRMNAPDVVRSTMSHKDLKYNESTIDSILGTPNKIVIPERYIPEQEPVLTAEEQLQRLRKAESIRKMLSETTALSTPDLSAEGAEEDKKSSTLKKKVEEEKKQREHLLELNQILAQQVMEKSKLVAGSMSASSNHQD